MDDKIEKYINGLLTEDELNLFLEEIKKNPNLRATIDIYKDMNLIYKDDDWNITENTEKNPTIEKHITFLRSKKGNQIKNTILKEEENYFKQPKTKLKRLISLTASIAAILAIGIFLFNTSKSNIELYNDYKNNWQELPSLTSRGESKTTADIETLFNNKKHKEALNAINSYNLKTGTFDSQLLIYKGVIHLELNNYKKAINTFKKLQSSNSIDAFKAHWYLALTYLKTSEKDLALKELNLLISKTTIFKHNEANSLIKKLQ